MENGECESGSARDVSSAMGSFSILHSSFSIARHQCCRELHAQRQFTADTQAAGHEKNIVHVFVDLDFHVEHVARANDLFEFSVLDACDNWGAGCAAIIGGVAPAMPGAPPPTIAARPSPR